MPVTVDHFVLSNGDTAKYDYDGLNNKPDMSRYLSLNEGTVISENADLNTVQFVQPGLYTCTKRENAQTLTNCPVTSAFVMSVRTTIGLFYASNKYNYLMREIYCLANNSVYRQLVDSNSSGTYTFYDWSQYIGTRASELQKSATSLNATGWTNVAVHIYIRSSCVYLKIAADYNGNVNSDWQGIVEGLPKPSGNFYYQFTNSSGKNLKLRVDTDGVLSVCDFSSSRSYGIETTISYPITW